MANVPMSSTGRARREQLVNAEQGARLERLGGVASLHRPDARRQPVEQLEIVGLISKQGLAQMDMGLDEPGNENEAGRVDDLHATRAQRRARGERDDAPVDDANIGAPNTPAPVLRHHDAMGDPGLFAFCHA